MFDSFNQDNPLCSFVHVRDDDIVETDGSLTLLLELGSTQLNNGQVRIMSPETVLTVEDNDSMCSAVDNAIHFVLLHYVLIHLKV